MTALRWTSPVFGAVAHLVTQRTGLIFDGNRRAFAEAGMRRAMSKLGIPQPDGRLLQATRSEAGFDLLLQELTVGETYFFRDPNQFDLLRRELLPKLRRGPLPRVRVWSAGCASGEEPYSLAILFEEEGLADRASVLGTDISPAALGKARRGVYTAWSFRGSRPELTRRYFQRRREGFAIDDRFHQRVSFRRLNLAADRYPTEQGGSQLDLILCRNVLIYFGRETIAQVGRRLLAALAPGGWLVCGASDPPLPEVPGVERLMTPGGLLYRRTTERQAAKRLPEGLRDIALSAPRATSLPAVLPSGLIVPITGPAPRPDGATGAAKLPSAEGCFLDAMRLLEQGEEEAALHALRRALYLNPDLAFPQLARAQILQRRGKLADAERAYRRGWARLAGRPADEIVPLSDGASTAALTQVVAERLAELASRVA